MKRTSTACGSAPLRGSEVVLTDLLGSVRGRHRGRRTEGRYPGGGTVEAIRGHGERLPVVLVATGEPADILASAQAGVRVEPGDIDGVAEALRRLSHSKEKRVRLDAAGRVAAVERFDRRPLSDQFIEALERA